MVIISFQLSSNNLYVFQRNKNQGILEGAPLSIEKPEGMNYMQAKYLSDAGEKKEWKKSLPEIETWLQGLKKQKCIVNNE